MKYGDILVGKVVGDQFERIANAPSIRPATLGSILDYPTVEHNFRYLQDEFGTNDPPHVVKAMFEAILFSTNPTLVAELKKLYVLAKLSLDSDDPRLEVAHNQTRVTDRRNRETEAHNAAEIIRYDNETKQRAEEYEAKYKAVFKWWDDMLEQLDKSFAGKKREQILESVWDRIIIDTINSVSEPSGIKNFRKDWFYRKRDISLLQSKQLLEDWSHPKDIADYIIEVRYGIENRHRKFINDEYNDVCESLRKKADYRSEMKRIKHALEKPTVYWRDRGGYFDKYNPYDNSYVPYDSYSSNSYDSYRRFREEVEYKYQNELSYLEMQVENGAREIMQSRKFAGMDGYDEIYDFGPKPKPKKQNLDIDDVIMDNYGRIRRYWARDDYGNSF